MTLKHIIICNIYNYLKPVNRVQIIWIKNSYLKLQQFKSKVGEGGRERLPFK